MALDDQLAALAAGELDDGTARALRARAAADPALARRLARHEQLQRLLAGWDTPPMSEQAAQRLHARVDEALAALGDEPLAEQTGSAAPAIPAIPAAPEREQRAGVADLDRARRRRASSGGGRAATAGGGTLAWPSWGAGVAVAAVLAAIVGVGVVLGGLPGGTDLDMLAGGDDAAETAEDTAQLKQPDGGAARSSDEAADSAPAGEPVEEDAAADADSAADGAEPGPARRDDVVVAEGELLSLVDLAEAPPQSDAQADDVGAGDEGSTAEVGQECVAEALRRDTAQAEGREVRLLAEGTYAGIDAVFVVVRTPQEDGGHRFEVLAHDPVGCSLLARDETSR